MWLQNVESYIGRTLFIILRILFFVFFIRFFILEFGIVSGPSMMPNFQDGQIFMVLKPPFFRRSPERFEVVQFVDPENERKLLIKRVLGLPGERVTIRRNHVCISHPTGENEECLDEPYLPDWAVTTVKKGGSMTIVVPRGSYFLMGDNRIASFDSRDFGPVPRQNIVGLTFPL